MRSLILVFAGVLAFTSTGASALAKPAPPRVEPPAWLGVGFNGNGRRVEIDEVIRDTPADIAGLVLRDVIVAIDDQSVRTGNDLVSVISTHRVGDRVKVSVQRRGRRLELWTELSGKLDASELIQRRLVDNPAPPFSLPRIHGKHSGNLVSLRDKVVVIEFWSSACSGCQKTLEKLASFEAEHLGDVAVLLITPESPRALRSYLKNYSLPFTVLTDSGAHIKNRYRSDLAGPTVVVIGRDGVVRHADTGIHLNIDDLLLEATRAVRESPAI